VDDARRNDEALAGVELDCFVFEVDEEPSFNREEELVIVVVLVPVIFAFNDADANNGVVYFAEGLVEPLVIPGVGDVDVDDFEWTVEDVEPGLIGEGSGVGHGRTPLREDSRSKSRVGSTKPSFCPLDGEVLWRVQGFEGAWPIWKRTDMEFSSSRPGRKSQSAREDESKVTAD
jgi:hypothetical protein